MLPATKKRLPIIYNQAASVIHQFHIFHDVNRTLCFPFNQGSYVTTDKYWIMKVYQLLELEDYDPMRVLEEIAWEIVIWAVQNYKNFPEYPDRKREVQYVKNVMQSAAEDRDNPVVDLKMLARVHGFRYGEVREMMWEIIMGDLMSHIGQTIAKAKKMIRDERRNLIARRRIHESTHGYAPLITELIDYVAADTIRYYRDSIQYYRNTPAPISQRVKDALHALIYDPERITSFINDINKHPDLQIDTPRNLDEYREFRAQLRQAIEDSIADVEVVTRRARRKAKGLSRITGD